MLERFTKLATKLILPQVVGEFNDVTTRERVKAIVNSILLLMDELNIQVECDKELNTPEIIDKNILKFRIYGKPSFGGDIDKIFTIGTKVIDYKCFDFSSKASYKIKDTKCQESKIY